MEPRNEQTVNVNVGTQLVAKTTKVNKHIFVWICNFLFGGFGVDRFVRGQIGLGILKIILVIPTCGIWVLIDFIISIVKAYSTFSGEDEITFVNGKYGQ